ncbi:MAG: hypothetical protein ABI882_09555, partial [Acidobacteriota bacterium]
ILVAGGTVQAEEREYEVPVEAKTFRLQFSARLSGDVAFEVLGPAGKLQPLTEPNIGSTIGRDWRTIIIFDPKPGKWRVRVRGTGSFTTAVSTQSELYVCCITLLGPSGAIQANPLPMSVPVKTRQAMMQASIAGFEVLSVEFEAIDENNKRISPIRLRQNDYSNPYLVVMLVEPDAKPFRVLARGMDQTGYPFQRVFPTLFQPGTEDLTAAAPRDQQLTDMLQNSEPGPYRLVRTKVEDLVDEPLLSESGSPIGVRLQFSLRFPKEGFYTPLPQVYPDRIVSGYTGALSMRVHRLEVAPVPEGPQPAVAMRYMARASYKANQLYRFTIDMVPNYAQYNEQKRNFCIMSKAFSYGSSERFLSEVTSETKVRFRISIMGTDIDGRQPGTSEHTYVPNMWYTGFLKDGSAECQ